MKARTQLRDPLRIASLLLAAFMYGAPASAKEKAELPAPPVGYVIPPDAIRVTNTQELLTALRSKIPRAILLANGIYDHRTYFSNSCGHSLYAQNLGRAVLKAGLSIGSFWCEGGGVVQGLKFDVADPTKTLHSSVIHVWGNAANTTIADVRVEGRGRVGSGIVVRRLDGVTIERAVVRSFLEYGVQINGNYRRKTSPSISIQDLDVSAVSHKKPLSSNGTAEACLWVANRAEVRRVRVRDCAWTGVWTGKTSRGSSFSDVTIDRSRKGIGLYLEHFTRGVTFSRFNIGPNIKIGAICEWADPDWGGRAACGDVVIEDSTFRTSCVGVYLDQGTAATTIRRSVFANQRWAAISDYRGEGNAEAENDFSGVRVGIPISTEHYQSYCF